MKPLFLSIPEKKNLGVLLILLFFYTGLLAQETRVISGILKDDTGSPVPGANIIIKGTTTGVITDINGYYTIAAPVGSTLIISYLGYGTREVYVAPGKDSIPVYKNRLEGKVKSGDALAQIHQPKVFHHSIPNSEKTLSPYFFVQSDDPAVDRMPLKSTSVEAAVSGVIADVRVKQVYVNEGKNTLEAIYIFPGSSQAAVYGMTMKIGNRLLHAQIREKQQARKEYEAARQEGKTATLLEQQRPNVFQMNVANILPGDSIEVELSYTELLESVDGIYEFVYPTVVGPRYSETPDIQRNEGEKWVENPYLHQGENPNYTFSLQVKLNTGIPIQKIFSPSHLTNIVYQDKDKAVINLNEKEHQGGNRDFILQYGLRGGKVESGILLHAQGDEQFFLLMMEPPVAPKPEDIPGREYIFIMDVSGSMSGFPLDISKSAMLELLGRLRETDKFNILTFAGGNNLLWNQSREATPENISEAASFTNYQSGGGGTRLLDALTRALKIQPEEGYSRSFVVMTDGYVDVEKETFNLVRSHLGSANLFALGIGTSTNRYLIEGLAHAGMGEKFIATNPNEGKTIASKLIDYIEKPVLTNISIDFGDFQAYDYDPISIPDVFAQRPILIYGKYSGSAEGIIKIKGLSGNVLYTKTFNLKEASIDNNQALRYLWARNKIKYLDDYAQYYTASYQNDSKPPKTEDQIHDITQLGLKYNLLTQYTSFIAVDSLIRNKSQKIISVKQPLPMPKGVSDLAIGSGNSQPALSTISGDDLNLSLTPEISSLEEVVVVGYGTMKKSELTASVANVKREELTGNGSPQQLLQGRVAGLQIVGNSGAPGSNAVVKIRGTSTLMGNQQPLYIIDGIPVSGNEDPSVNPLLNIDPASIATIEVLKDAAATSLYGSRASAGVIIIATKRGETPKTQFTITAGSGMNTISKTKFSESVNNLWYHDLIRHGSFQSLQVAMTGRKSNFRYVASLNGNLENGVLKGSGIHKINANIGLTWNLFHGLVETGINGWMGFARMNHYTMLNDSDSQVYAIPSVRKLINGDGRWFVNVKLPLEGLKLKTEITSSSNSKHMLLDDSTTPISFNTLLNDNVVLHNTQVNAGLEYFSMLNNNSQLQIRGYYLYNAINNQYNDHVSGNPESSYPLRAITQDYRLHRIVLSADYTLMERYVINGSLGQEASTRFSSANQRIIQPLISFAWNVNKEPFLQSLAWVTNLKLRYNFGQSGNCQFPFYPLSTLINDLGSTGIPSVTENNNLNWEKIRKQNVGMDLGLFNERVKLILDYFRNSTRDMYYLSCIDQNKLIYEWINAGDFKNKGFEIGVNGYLYRQNHFTLTAYVNFSVNRTEITSLNTSTDGFQLNSVDGLFTGQSLRVGDPIGVYYGLKVKQIDFVKQEILYEDKNKNGSVGLEDFQCIANTNPDYYGGAGFQAVYNKLELNAGLTYVAGNQVIRTNGNLDKYQAFTTNKSFEEEALSNLNVENGSYLRISELSLGYELPAGWIKKAGLNQVKIRLIANNLLTFTRYSGQDPEFNNYYFNDREMAKVLPGVDRNFYPVSRSFQLRLEIGF